MKRSKYWPKNKSSYEEWQEYAKNVEKNFEEKRKRKNLRLKKIESRKKRMLKLRNKHKTYSEIGRVFHITKQRVQQIIKG